MWHYVFEPFKVEMSKMDAYHMIQFLIKKLKLYTKLVPETVP